jgi:hypothetical protein
MHFYVVSKQNWEDKLARRGGDRKSQKEYSPVVQRDLPLRDSLKSDTLGEYSPKKCHAARVEIFDSPNGDRLAREYSFSSLVLILQEYGTQQFGG